MSITTTLDPICLRGAPKNPQLLLRDGDLAIYFESIENMDAHRDMHVERPGADLKHRLDNPTEESGTDWNQPKRRLSMPANRLRQYRSR